MARVYVTEKYKSGTADLKDAVTIYFLFARATGLSRLRSNMIDTATIKKQRGDELKNEDEFVCGIAKVCVAIDEKQSQRKHKPAQQRANSPATGQGEEPVVVGEIKHGTEQACHSDECQYCKGKCAFVTGNNRRYGGDDCSSIIGRVPLAIINLPAGAAWRASNHPCGFA